MSWDFRVSQLRHNEPAFQNTEMQNELNRPMQYNGHRRVNKQLPKVPKRSECAHYIPEIPNVFSSSFQRIIYKY